VYDSCVLATRPSGGTRNRRSRLDLDHDVDGRDLLTWHLHAAPDRLGFDSFEARLVVVSIATQDPDHRMASGALDLRAPEDSLS